jgi:hypothetical protein
VKNSQQAKRARKLPVASFSLRLLNKLQIFTPRNRLFY